MFDGLRQAHICRHHQGGTSQLPRAERLTIGSSEDGRIASPAITAPRQRLALRAGDGESHRSFDQVVADAPSRAGSDEAAGAILHETSPAFAGIDFADFMVSIGVTIRVCKAYTPQTKGKVERTVSSVKSGFWPGVTFTDLDDLNRQAFAWCERINSRVHRTTHMRPIDRLPEELLAALPQEFAWERFGMEERKVSWDGSISYDGVLYGLPAETALAGRMVHVRERKGELSIWSETQCVLTIAKRVHSQDIVSHPDQWKGVPSVSAARATSTPLGHREAAPEVASRPLGEYDAYFEVGVPA